MTPAPADGAAGEAVRHVLGLHGERVLARVARATIDGSPVLVADSAFEDPTPAFLDRLAHEHGLRDDLDAGWALRPREMVRERGRPVLVLDDPGGEPLAGLLGAPFEIAGFLRLAAGMAAALAAIHRQGLVHRDVTPANIFVGCPDGKVRFTGFGVASRLPRERQAPAPPEQIVGTFAYMAPEQTGRMNRSIDTRSDLYGLGVVLYQMLTGVLPFTASEPLEWIHCHVARRPVPPQDLVPGLPGPVSAIVAKLLSKAAEDRYQTADGLRADLLECLARWEAGCAVAPFELAARDASGELVFSERLYGREAEVERLVAVFGRVVGRGTAEFALVSGTPGIGKSSIVHELHRVLAPAGGLFAAGKFDQYKRGIPYATLAQAFRGLIRQILVESDAELARWRAALAEALGRNGRLMVDLIPELVHVVGAQPPVPELSPQDAQSRFQIVFRRFLGVFARSEHPLVLFLDDLQWVDAATAELVAALLVQPGLGHLLVVGAYRDDEVGPDHPLRGALAAVRQAGREIHDLALGPLSLDHVEEMIADALRVEPTSVRALAELIFDRTGGNPFFATHFVSELADEGLLVFDPAAAAWTWDMRGILAKGFTDNVAELMAAKLARLAQPTRETLKLMACLGNVTRTATLALVRGTSEADVHLALWPAVRADLVFPHAGSYRFLHDRIHEAAYATLAEPERAGAHLRIGRLLAAQTPPEDLDGRIFEIVDQLGRGAAALETEAERLQVAALGLAAGRRAKAGTAYAPALRHLAAGRALLPADSWERHYRLTFDLELGLAECEFLTGDFAAAEARFGDLAGRARDSIDLAAATRLLLDLFVTMGDMDRAITCGLDYLRRTDPGWPAAVTVETARRAYDRLAGRLARLPPGGLLDLPPMTDPAERATMDVLTALSSPTLFGGEALRQLVVCRMVETCLDHGNSDGAPLAYVLLGSIQGMFFGAYALGAELAAVGLELVERPGFGRFRARVYSVYGVHVGNWTQPLAVARGYLRKAFDAAQESGDISFAAFSCIDLVTNLLASGAPLGEVEQEAAKNREIAAGLRFGVIRRGIAEQLAAIRMARGRAEAAVSFDDAVMEADQHLPVDTGTRAFAAGAPRGDARHRSAHAIASIRELKARVLMGDAAGAVAAVARDPPLWTVPTQFERAEYQFYEALARAALCDGADDDARAAHLEVVRGHHRQLAVWAASCPETFDNRAALVGAEIARLEGRPLEAEGLYEQAIAAAAAHGFVQNQALAHERAARFYAARGLDRFARLELVNARRCFRSWGADGVVARLDREHRWLGDADRPAPAGAGGGASIEHLDLATVLRISQAVSGEIVLDRLLDTIVRIAVEQAGAERGVLMVMHPQGLRIAVEATIGGGEVAVALKDVPVAEAALPATVLRYVVHTHETLVLEDAAAEAAFAADAYVAARRARSILCLPLVNHGTLIGVLYLENNLSPRVFAPARIPTLKLVASQAAISLENTQLYRDLEARGAKIRRLVDANIIGIFFWDQEGRIFEANDAFLRIIGYDRAELEAGEIRWTELTPPEWRALDDVRDRAYRETGFLPPYEKEYRRHDGTRVPVLIGMATFEEDGTEGVAFVLDLSERKRAEAEARENERRYRDVQARLAHANRVATMGQLTASIAHEVSQPIAATLVNAQAALRWMDRQPPELAEVRQVLEDIAADGKRAGEVIDRMRALFRRTPSPREGLDVNEAVGEVVGLTRGEAAKHGVAVQTRLGRDLPAVRGDRVQLRQVVLNLVVNAIEAMAEDGGDDRNLVITSERNGADGVRVMVADSGPGLSEAELEHVFDAFHTTKSSGLGMGLSICRSIIEAHDGRLWVSPNRPRGAVFQFTLPAG